MDYSNLFVCLMGVGTVFVGLICIIILVKIMSGIVRKSDKTPAADSSVKAGQPQASDMMIHKSTDNVTPELVAAVSAVIAEQMGSEVGAIRIKSLKKVSA